LDALDMIGETGDEIHYYYFGSDNMFGHYEMRTYTPFHLVAGYKYPEDLNK
jgi:hypothetical protein